MQKSETLGALAGALAKFQGEVKAPGKNANNPHFGSKYATLDDCIAAITDTAPNHGLSYFQSLGTVGDNAFVTTTILHESGEWIESDPAYAPALQKLKGGATEFNAQGVGSAGTYLRRYSLVAAFGLASEDDDDGNNAGGKAPTNEAPPAPDSITAPMIGKAKVMVEQMVKAGADRKNLWAAVKDKLGTDNFEQMTKVQGMQLISLLEAWKGKMEEQQQKAEPSEGEQQR